MKRAALEDAREELKRLGNRRNEIEARLKSISSKSKEDARPVATVVDAAIRVLETERRRLLQMPVAVMRDLVNQLITDLTVDMETKNIELTVALPTWAIHAAKQTTKEKQSNDAESSILSYEALCPATTSRSQMGEWTHKSLATFRCEYEWSRGSTTAPPCYRCSRSAA